MAAPAVPVVPSEGFMATPDDPVAAPEDPVAPSKVLLDVWRVIATLGDGIYVDFDDAEAVRGAADNEA